MIVNDLLATARENLRTLDEDATLIEAARILAAGIDIVVVCGTDGALRGVVTKTDIVRRISVCEGTSCQCPLSAVMTREVTLCRGGEPLSDVAEAMKQQHRKHIPIVDDTDRPIGVLTTRAVLRALLGDARYEEAQLIDYVKGIGYR